MPESASHRAGLECLLSPRSVAVVGASADLERFNGRVVKNLLRHGYAGRVYPVNPKYESVAGTRCWPSLRALPETPDNVFIAVGREKVLDVMRECAERGVPAVTIYTAGFAESGEEGRRLEEQAADLARESGIRVCGPNTAGVCNFHEKFHLAGIIALELERVVPGSIGVVCQSGSIGGALLSRATHRGIGFSYLISCGNEMDLEVSDYVDFLVDDPDTRSIAIYLEGVRNGARFLRVAKRALEAEKPLVVLKVGRAAEGRKAALSHTAALVGEDRAYDAVFRRWGVTRVVGIEPLFEVAHMFSVSRRPRGKRVGIVTTTGGGGALMADECGALGLELPRADERMRGALRGVLPDAAGAENPFDTTIAGIGAFGEILKLAMREGPFDVMIPIVGSSAQFRPGIGVEPILKARREKWAEDKPMLAYLNPHAEEAHRLLAQAGVPSFHTIEGCARAARHLTRYAHVAGRGEGTAADSMEWIFPEDMDPLLARGGALNEAQSLALAEFAGIRAVAHRVCRDAESIVQAAEGIGYPVVLKALSSGIAHKTDLGLVETNLQSEGALLSAYQRIEKNLSALDPAPRREGYLVQEMVPKGLECLVGVVCDAQFGHLVTLGWGGIHAEAMGSVTARPVPLGRDDAQEMIDELRGGRLFGPWRGRGPFDRDALADVIFCLGRLAAALGGRLEEADLNPVFVLPEGEGCLIADGLFVLKAD